MRQMRRTATLAGLLIVTTLAVATVVSAEPVLTADISVVIGHPLSAVAGFGSMRTPVVPEAGTLLLVGTGLIGLAAIVRRTTRA